MISIRTMTLQDIPRVAAMEKMIFPDPWSEKVYEETLRLPEAKYVIAQSGEMIAGAAGVRNIVGTGEITNVMVLPEYRRQGIGRMMMEEVLNRGRALGADEFTLEVRAGNAAAIGLYESLGFVSEGVRPRFYRNPVEDALIMWIRKC
ncbi:MAG: ribosomal protein S18-alanine N-acetyltransferase [Lachnospiraceae bacterium]|nr:ribosomal protein S18-alanine N-acetyltransferase [Lachnospiraceae bacterium]